MPMQQLTPGVWQFRVSTGKDPITGKYGREVRHFHGSKKDAAVAYAAFVQDVAKGQVTPKSATLNDAIAKFLEVAIIEPLTRQGYESKWKCHVKDGIGTRRLAELVPMDLTRFYASLLEGGLSPASIRGVHALIRSGCKTACNELGWLTHNPAIHARLPRRTTHEIWPPADDALDRLMVAAEKSDPTFALLLELAIGMGGRRGEVVALRRSDLVDEEDGGMLLHVRHAAYVLPGEPVKLKDPKSHQRRQVRLAPDLARALRAHLARQTMEAHAHGITLCEDPFVFPARSAPDASRPIRPDHVTNRFMAIWKRANPGTHARLHDLRHYHATELVDAGVPLVVIQKRLGHANLSTTSIYTHSRDEADKAAAEAFEARRRRSS